MPKAANKDADTFRSTEVSVVREGESASAERKRKAASSNAKRVPSLGGRRAAATRMARLRAVRAAEERHGERR